MSGKRIGTSADFFASFGRKLNPSVDVRHTQARIDALEQDVFAAICIYPQPPDLVRIVAREMPDMEILRVDQYIVCQAK